MEDAPPTDSQCRVADVKTCGSLLHRIRTIQGKTNLNLSEPHFAGNDERKGRNPATAAVDFRKRIRRQQEILEKCKRKVADQLDELHSAKKVLLKSDCYETGDHTDNRLKISQVFGKSKKRAATTRQDEDVALAQSQAVTCLTDDVQTVSKEHHLKTIVDSAVARLNQAKSSVQKVMRDNADATRKQIKTTEAPLHGILKDKTPANSVAKEIARAQSARLPRKPRRRLLKKQTKSAGCLPKAPQEIPPEATTEEEEDVRVKIARNTDRTLSTLSEQMSVTLQESIAHLNDLCMRVRNCLTEIEADELNYRKRKGFAPPPPPPSECDGEEEVAAQNHPPVSLLQVEELQYIPNSDQSFDEPSVETTIEQVITAISLGNGEIRMDPPEPQAPPPTPATPTRVEDEAQKKRARKKRKRAKKPNGSLTKLPSAGKIECTPPRQVSSSKLPPIWQRQLPSIIEEIQQTVKKQATRTQYKEFLKTLKHLARRENKSVLPPPQQNVARGEVQSVSPPTKSERAQPKQPRQVPQRLKDALEVTGLSEAKKSKPCAQCCSSDRCACGVRVENLRPTDSLSARQKLQWIKTRCDATNGGGFQTYDILDEITPKDVEPIQSEYPRKDHVPSTASLKPVEDTLLYQLVHNRNPKLLEAFLQSTSFLDDALKRNRRNAAEKSPSERHVTTINRVEPKLRPKSASNAYRLYEKLEFDRDIAPPPERATPADLTKEIQVVKAPKAKPKPKRIDSAPRPSEKTAEEKLRLLNKGGAPKKKAKRALQDPNFKMKKILTVDQRPQIAAKPKEVIKTKLKRYMVDPSKIFAVTKRDVIEKLKPYIFMNARKNFAVYPVQVRYEYQETDGKQKTVKISRNGGDAGVAMTKRDVIKRLKPYIFMNLAPAEVTVMPVSAKYNSRAGHRPSENTVAAKPPSSKRTPWFPKDHGDDCHTGKKLCKKCQLHSGLERARHPEEFTVMTHMEHNYLSPRTPYWGNRKTTGEHMVSVVVKNTPRAKPNATKNTKQEAMMTCKELYKNATSTRNKLKEVKKMAKKNDLTSRGLQEIIDTIEFKIVDVLSNPRNDRRGALRHIEDEIKCVLEMVTPKPAKSKLAAAAAATPPKILSARRESAVKIESPGRRKQGATPPSDDKTICIYAQAPLENSLQISARKEPEAIRAGGVDSEEEEELRSIDESIEKVIGELDNLISPVDVEAATLANEGAELKPIVGPSKDVEVTFAEAPARSAVVDLEGRETPDVVKSAEDDDDVVIIEEKYSCEHLVTNFCKQVDTVIKKIAMSEESLAQEPQENDPAPADEYLTPYMRAIKDYRRSTNRTRSFMDFLDELSHLSQEDTTAVHYHCVHALQRASVENVRGIKDVIRRFHVSSLGEASEKRKKTKNRRLQTLPLNDDDEVEDYNRNQDVQTEGEYIEEEEPPQVNRGTQHEPAAASSSKDFESHSFSWSLLSESLGEIPELTEAAVDVRVLTKDGVTQVPSAGDHRCFAVGENRPTQVTDELRRTCTRAVDSQVSELHFKVASHSVGVETDESSPGDTRSIQSDGSYDRIKDFVCITSRPGEGAALENEEVVTATEEEELRVSLGVNTSDVVVGDGKFHLDDADSETAKAHLLGSVYGVVFAVVFLGLNLQYSC